ncbi:DUF1593-domain-containing protein [Mycena venus]|uniref:DUF1593-domain-containing protein n=1 Tax=Mycena venus TaxID=2733690 RepID=A0A8H7DDX1_9AGAR|nr:DUF1593-domain-containing protein [Mycena venus]
MVRISMTTFATLALLLFTAPLRAATQCAESIDLTKLQTFSSKPRMFILSDILNEPDDSMSLVRYLLYANEFDTRGLCAVTSTWLRNSTHPEEMRKIVTAYGLVVDQLNCHVHPEFAYQPAEHFLSLITSGPPVFGKKALNMSLSEGAQRLIAALEESNESLHVAVWGGVNTLAQALQHMSQTMMTPVPGSGAHWPDIFYIVSIHGWNNYDQATWPGINSGNGPDPTKTLNPWLDANIRLGPLGAVYPQVEFGMEGDTPSWLWLVQNGLGYSDHIEWGSWGGRYLRATDLVDWVSPEVDGNLWSDITEQAIGADGILHSENKASIWRWRDAMQDDFAERIQWTLTNNFSAVAHPPILVINGHGGPDPVFMKATENGTFILDASDTIDVDRPQDDSQLDYAWLLYIDVTTSAPLPYPGEIKLESLAPPASDPVLANNTAGFQNFTLGPKVQVTTPPISINGQTGESNPDIHIVLQVTNTAGIHPIRRYKRVIFSYN